MGFISLTQKPREAPNFGRGCIRSNISLNGRPFLKLRMVRIVSFGKTVGYILFHLRYIMRTSIGWQDIQGFRLQAAGLSRIGMWTFVELSPVRNFRGRHYYTMSYNISL
jgi:hypothetical protein